MPWSTPTVSERRTALIHTVRTAGRPVAQVCRDFGVSRKTAYKWLARHAADPDAPPADRSRRPHASPSRTATALADAVLAVRDQFGWGPRKIVAYLRNHDRPAPPVRTAAAILRRNGRVRAPTPQPAAAQRFERGTPNELWQLDFKGFVWVGRQKVYPLTVLDDHSRYLLAADPCTDQTMATAWAGLWRVFGEVGLPDAVLCDNAFGTHNPGVPSVSWFEAQLLRLGVRPIHGRAYHPQTQGKVERFHGTLVREVWPTIRRDTLAHFAADLARWRVGVYNAVRPHEALGDRPPVTRWQPSRRPRPAVLPAVEYPAGAVLRKVAGTGDITWHCARILVGRGLTGEWVRVEEADGDLVVRYADHPVRRVPLATLGAGGML
jgi:transposase InsO family protein